MHEDMAEAVNNDDYATVHKLAHALAEKCRGPNKRRYKAPSSNNCGKRGVAGVLTETSRKSWHGCSDNR